MPGFSCPWGSLSWKKTRSVRRSLEIVGARLRTMPGNELARKGGELRRAGLALFHQPDAALGHFGGDDGRALGGLASNSGSIPA